MGTLSGTAAGKQSLVMMWSREQRERERNSHT